MKELRKQYYFFNMYRVLIYLIGLIGTCFGVVFILKTDWGLDAWNGVFVGLAKLTPLSMGIWSVIIQGCFWVFASVLNRKADWLCVIPIFLKGVFLDMAKEAVACVSVPCGFLANSALFLLGYMFVAVGTGVYVTAGYSKMPIDGLMTALANFFSWNIRKARLAIELCGFALLVLAKGPFGIGTVMITLTIGSVISGSCRVAKKILFIRGGTIC